jgi:hypothetical protein
MRRRRLAAVTLATVMLAAACGGSSSGSSPDAIVRRAPDRFVAQGSARVDGTVTLRGMPQLPGGQSNTTFSGAFRLKTHDGKRTGSIVLDLSNLLAGGAQGNPNLRAVQVRVVDGVLYMDLHSNGAPTGSANPLLDARWLKLDPSALGAGLEGGATDVPAAFEMLAEARTGSAQVVGTESIKGVSATHYRAEVPYRTVLSKIPIEVRRDALGTTKTGVQEPVPVDVWLDSKGVPQRLSLTLDIGRLGLPDVPRGAVLRYRVDASDFGIDIDAREPPRAEVIDFVEYARLLSLAAQAAGQGPDASSDAGRATTPTTTG